MRVLCRNGLAPAYHSSNAEELFGHNQLTDASIVGRQRRSGATYFFTFHTVIELLVRDAKKYVTRGALRAETRQARRRFARRRRQRRRVQRLTS